MTKSEGRMEDIAGHTGGARCSGLVGLARLVIPGERGNFARTGR
jgi:hypothetical protein